MTQWILCTSCADKHRERYPLLKVVASVSGERLAGELFPASDHGQAERGTMQRGRGRYAMVCDHCDAVLAAGVAAWAVGIIAGDQIVPPAWEQEYLRPVDGELMGDPS